MTMPPDEPNDEEKLEELPEDNQTPFQPAAPPRDDSMAVDDDDQPTTDIDSTHPATDTGIQPEESYEAGLGEASGASEPNAGNAVTGMTDDQDGDNEEE
jgi:hypothetical protein